MRACDKVDVPVFVQRQAARYVDAVVDFSVVLLTQVPQTQALPKTQSKSFRNQFINRVVFFCRFLRQCEATYDMFMGKIAAAQQSDCAVVSCDSRERWSAAEPTRLEDPSVPKLTFKLCLQESAGCASLDTDKCCVRGCFEQRRFRTWSLRPLMSALCVFAGLARGSFFANRCSETGAGNKLGHPILLFAFFLVACLQTELLSSDLRSAHEVHLRPSLASPKSSHFSYTRASAWTRRT